MQETTINLRSVRPSQVSAGFDSSSSMRKKSGKGWILIILLLAIIIGGGAFGVIKYKKEWIVTNHSGYIDNSKYQAVFLSNGQVYFGKITNDESIFVHLSEVYYLVNNGALQKQTVDGDGATDTTNKPNSDYSLIKLGNELHGPENMEINRDQILFIENLSNDSKLVNAIKNMQK